MKRLLIVIILIIGCVINPVFSQNKKPNNVSFVTHQNGNIRISDNEKLDFTFRDNGFSTWLKKQKPQKHFYESNLVMINLQYVNEWNKRVGNSDFKSSFYTQKIEYQLHSKKHYGLEINYYLYMFFKYFEKKYETILKRH
jgi:hypothetical protein